MTHADGLTNGRIDRAGELLRDWRTSDELFDPSLIEDALATVEAFRRQFTERQILARVRIGAEGMARSASQEVLDVTQRTKRTDRIIGKLVRHPTMRLTRMQDIVGCRIVVTTLPELEAVSDRLMRQWEGHLLRVDDYVTAPKSTGYRARHLVIRREGLPVEVQIRTQRQHNWARSVEYWESETRELLKDGLGNPKRVAFLRQIAELSGFLDRGEAPPYELIAELSRAGEAVD